MNLIDWKKKFLALARNKTLLYSIIALIAVLIVGGVFFSRYEAKRSAEEKIAWQKKQAEQARAEMIRSATYARQTFFLASPVGERAGMNMPSYQEGKWRISDSMNKDKKMTIYFVKDEPNIVPLMYIRYGEKKGFVFETGEKELPTGKANLTYAYYFYPPEKYQGSDKDDYLFVQEDFVKALNTFSLF